MVNNMEKKNRVVEIFKYIIIAILSIILIINLYVLIQSKLHPGKVPGLFGYKPLIVMSGSMENEMEIGDLVIVKDVPNTEIDKNNIIAYHDIDGKIVTHRVLEIIVKDNERCFRTKGDMNNAQDDTIVCSNSIEGKFYKNYKGLGKLVLFFQDPVGFALLLCTVTVICILIYKNFDKDKITKEELEEFREYKKKKEKRKNN